MHPCRSSAGTAIIAQNVYTSIRYALMSRVRLGLSHRAYEDSPLCLLRLRLALFSTIPRTKTCPWEPWSNWAMLFIDQVFAFSFFGKFLLLPLFLLDRKSVV